jgi:DUF4097 and DUF4098 domain-containing protein YvlB
MTVSGNFSEIDADSSSGNLDIRIIGSAQSAEMNTVSGDIGYRVNTVF